MRPKWKQIYTGAYALQDKGPAGPVSMFLLVGSRKALLIDSGYGLLDLPELIGQLTDKPVIQASTHGHLDHANGSWQFEERYLHPADLEIYQAHASREFLHKSYEKEQSDSRLQQMMDASPVAMQMLEDGMIFDLGDRNISVLHMPGHTKGCVCFLDEENQAAFTGDNLCRSIWLSLPESLGVSEYREVLARTLRVMENKNIQWNYAAHNPRKSRVQDDIQRFIACCDTILSGTRKPRFLNAGPTSGYFMGKAGRYILYPKE